MSRPFIRDDSDAAGEYRGKASEWHGGQWSPMYAYCSSGAVVVGLAAEIREAIGLAETPDYLDDDCDPDEESETLRAWLAHVEPIEAQLTADEA